MTVRQQADRQQAGSYSVRLVDSQSVRHSSVVSHRSVSQAEAGQQLAGSQSVSKLVSQSVSQCVSKAVRW